MAAVIDGEVATLLRDTALVSGPPPAEGAFLEAHYQHDSLRRLRGSFPGELGRATETYYFNPTLFLVVRTDERYDAPLSGRVRDSRSDRIYLGDGGVVRWLRRPEAHPALDSAGAAGAGDSLNAAAQQLLARIPRRQVGP